MTGRLDQELYADFEQLRRERARTDADITAFAAALTPERLAAEITYRTTAGVEQRHVALVGRVALLQSPDASPRPGDHAARRRPATTPA